MISKKGKKRYAILVIVLFLLPNLFVVVTGLESYPFTCAPMFGHYIGDGTEFYAFRYIGETPAAAEVDLPLNLGKRDLVPSGRYFFSKVYGSCYDYSPFGSRPNDSPAKLEERLSSYFTAYTEALPIADTSTTYDLKSIRLEVWRLDEARNPVEKRVVGTYDVNAKKFTHTYTPNLEAHEYLEGTTL
ncbi:hypothetical protein SAMN05421823_101643 [Catalinimonas alkaloidigena]|uniref:Uncharacterized protein n=1 Tax=Catalinimonas alkaloidigena TaxID=1075417 RepID=A0A1G8YFU5_9BACT|nr:hypothetical protein [Catalinimonas alkaloidigena]SDK00920.1 hypothetical protein SAMN05421823_101643 [Catalinimonas alkaloidigena]